MLHILLLLLKIIGIVLLVVLALILLILCVVLLAPITYKASGSFYGKPDITARIRWLFFVLKADIDYHDGRLDITAKLLNKIIMDRHPDQSDDQEDEALDDVDEGKEKTESSESSVTAVEPAEQEQVNEQADAEALPEPEQVIPSDEPDEVGLRASETASKKEESVSEEGESQTVELTESAAAEKKAGTVQRLTKKIKRMIHRINERRQQRSFIQSDSMNKKETISVTEKISDAVDQLIDKADDVSDRVEAKLEKIEKKIDGLAEKADFIDKLLQTEYIQKTIAFAGKMLKSIGGHIKPRKLSGMIHYGTGNPASTGKILGYSSILYPLYGGKLEIVPDFTESVIEGELDMKGRIRLGVFVVWIMKGLLDKNVKKSIKLGLRIKKTKRFKEDILWQ